VLTAAPALADGPFDRPAPPARAAPAAPAHPVPEGPPARAATRTGRPARAAPTPARVVTPGDTLWGIAGADWPRWYAANSATIGADPDLIRPGQRLVPPAGVPA
jgi:nucleoid-associated protein YgaU